MLSSRRKVRFTLGVFFTSHDIPWLILLFFFLNVVAPPSSDAARVEGGLRGHLDIGLRGGSRPYEHDSGVQTTTTLIDDRVHLLPSKGITFFPIA